VRILFLVHPLQDYVSDPLYQGLVRLLGQENVVDYPSKAILHDPSAKLWFLPQIPARPHSEDEVQTLLANGFFDLVCLASYGPENLLAMSRLHNRVKFPPIAYIDGADDIRIRHELVQRYSISLYFKRDYVCGVRGRASEFWAFARLFRLNRALFDRTFPLPLSIAIDALPQFGPIPKQIDVSFTGRASHPRRVRAVDILSRMKGVTVSAAVYASHEDRKYKLKAGGLQRLFTKIWDNTRASEADQGLKKVPGDYYREIAASKIALALRGGGRCPSLRYFEIVGMGTMLLSDMPETLTPNDFVDRRHAVFCRRDLVNLDALVRHYLREEGEREAIAAEGHAHLLKYHTCERRAEYFLDICRRVL